MAVSIVLAIVGAAVTLTLAPWCSVFHQRTEK
jgi:lipopolysaccharide export LptBFGC system permease protein LptF